MTEQQIKQEALALLKKSGFPVSDAEMREIKVNDFGLGNPRIEGFTFVDLLRTDRLRITLHMLLPNQTLPQHQHPPYDDEIGKEEIIRTVWGQFKIYDEGGGSAEGLRIPEGKESYYTVYHETVLNPGDQYRVKPGVDHWFQGGPEGAVALAFQNRVDENRNIFYDPGSLGCPIPPVTRDK